MARQHTTPILLPLGTLATVPLVPLGQGVADGLISEAEIQAIIHAHPECLPIAEIDPMFLGPVPICTELATTAGPIDNFMVTPSGLPILIECKLWRNPEGRREVVGQILDYAKELSRWSSSDLQREVNRRLKTSGNALLDRVRSSVPDLNEIDFNDSLTANLRRGRFLLLIVGDGIREGVEAIAEYVQGHAGLHFSLGLVELPFYRLPNGSRVVVPRVLVRTAIITRTVIAVPEGFAIDDSSDIASEEANDPDRIALADDQQKFWAEFLKDLKLDDPEQLIPKPYRLGHQDFMLPAPSGSSWITAYRDLQHGEVGLFLSSHRNTPGDYAMQVAVENWESIRAALGGSAKLIVRDGRQRVSDSKKFGPLNKPEVRREAFVWLRERVNAFVNVLRPLVRSAAADFASKQG